MNDLERKREAIIYFFQQGKTNSEIVKAMKNDNVNYMLVARTIKRFLESGSTKKRHGPGRPRYTIGGHIMANSQCLLCLSQLEGTMSTNMGVASLCELLILSSFNQPSNQRNILSQYEENQESCTVCEHCVLIVYEMEEIKQHISKLEDQLRSNVVSIRAKLFDSSGLRIKRGHQHILGIRESLLHLTDNDDGDNSCLVEEIQIKTELDEEEDDLSATGTGEDELMEDNSAWSPMEEETGDCKEEELSFQPSGDSDGESEFCIIPDNNEKPESNKKRLERNIRNRKVSLSGNTKQVNKFANPAISKRESRPRTAKTRLSANYSYAEKKPAPLLPSIQNNNTKKVCRLRTTNAELRSENDEDEELFQRITVDMKNEKIDSRRYKCDYCSYSFLKEDALTRHVAQQHGYSCRMCDSKLRTQSAMEKHMKQKHKGASPYECSICSKRFSRESSIAAHMMQHETGDKIFSCSKCDKKFSLQLNFDRHLQLHQFDEEKPFVCDVCDTRFAKKEYFDKHFATHNKTTACPTCGKVCNNRDALKRHVRIHTGERPYKCARCDERFITSGKRKDHFVLKHEPSQAYTCTYCKKKIPNLTQLKVHMDWHEGNKRVSCDKCEEKFMDAAALRSHQVRVHDEPQLVCEECGATFVSDTGLKRHKRIHSGIKPFKCDICDAAFVTNSRLTQHKRSHTGERPFICEHCGKGFKHRHQLKSHVNRIHTKDYVTPIRYTCSHCGRGFESNVLMQAHIRSVHTGERPFVCHLCGKGFAINTVLTMHLKGKHKLKVQGKGWYALGKAKRDDFSEKDDSNGGDKEMMATTDPVSFSSSSHTSQPEPGWN